jgi:ferrous iron transport protein B
VPGRAADFVMVIPDMRLPAINDVLLLTVRRTYYFMKEAVPFFLLASLVLFVADRLGALDALERVSRPVVHGLLGLPDDSIRVFIKTMIRRENGAAELELVRGRFDNLQLVVTILVMTFLTPCVNAALVLIKERGFRNALLMLLAVSTYAVAVGAVVSNVCRLLGVDFS